MPNPTSSWRWPTPERQSAICRYPFKTNRVDESALKKNTIVSPDRVSAVVTRVNFGSVDAGIVWDVFVNHTPDEAELVRIPREKIVNSVVSAIARAGAKKPVAANAFVDFMSSE